MKTNLLLASIPAFIVALSGCGGGNSNSSPATAPTAAIVPEVFTGVFTDSPVNNLSFRTTTQSGRTNTAGEFQYQADETVEFFIGGIILGSAPASAELSPLNFAGVTTLNEAMANSIEHEVINRILFLQSLDRDQNPDNGIDLEGLNEALASETLDFSDPEFSQGKYRQIVNNNNGYFQSPRNALNHLLETLQQTVTVELPTRDSIDTNGDGVFNQVITLSYNQQGQLTERVATDVSSGVSQTLEEIEYDDNGNPIRIVTGSNIETITYHPLFGVTSSTTTFEDAVLFSNSSTFDAIGNIITLSNIVNFDNFPALPSVFSKFAEFPLATGELPRSMFFGATLTPQNFLEEQLVVPLDPAARGINPFNFLEPVDDIDLSSIAASYPPNVTTVINNTFNEQGHLTQSILMWMSGEFSNTSTSNFVYENDRPVSISITNEPFSSVSGSSLIETDFEYNPEGVLTGCERSTNGNPLPNDSAFFPLTDPISSISGTNIEADMINSFISCSESVEYDEQGRVKKIEQQPGRFFSRSITKVFEYTGAEVTRTTQTIASAPALEEVRSFAYSSTGQLVEATITINGELSFARRLEYTRATLDQLPNGS